MKSNQLKNNRSKKHHYLPRHYLKGFVDSRNSFFVYDKRNDRIIDKPLTPDVTFFENNLNTVIFPQGELSDFLENLYTKIENQSWGPLDNIRGSNRKTQIQLLDKMHLFLFLLFLHWRLPSNIEHVEKLSKYFFVKDYKDLSYFTIKSKSGESISTEIIDEIKNSSAFKKSSKLILPFAPFFNSSWVEKLKNWRFLYTGDGDNWHLVGDNPIITKGNNDHDPMNCLSEFVFPVSGNILLVNINKPINKDLSPDFVIQFNISIIERAQRFVACQNKDFLKALIEKYKLYVQFKKTYLIITEMFDVLEQQNNSAKK